MWRKRSLSLNIALLLLLLTICFLCLQINFEPCLSDVIYVEDLNSQTADGPSPRTTNHGKLATRGDRGRVFENKTLFVITPTFYRGEQKAELTRVYQALFPVSHFIHWIIVEDVQRSTEGASRDLLNFLERFDVKTTVLKSELPGKEKVVGNPRGVGGRRAAIKWIRQNASPSQGVLYFADDDNTYDSHIFTQMLQTKKISMWPVGLVTDFGVSSPIVKNGRVIGFYDGWTGHRKFPVDMAGFAVNLELLFDKPKANMPWIAGYEEDKFLASLGISIRDIEPLANNCTEILVWHTKTISPKWAKQPKNINKYSQYTNLEKLLLALPQKQYTLQKTTNSIGKSQENFTAFNSFLNLLLGSA